MRWSFPLARVLGIHVDVHATFPLLLAWIGWLSGQAQGWGAVPWSLLLIITLFVCVTLHELGHCVVARRYGVQVRRITLLPIGGVAHLGTIPERPVEELLIAIGGPLVNVALAAALVPFAPGWVDWSSGNVFPVTWSGLIERVIQANLAMLLFNLIPAFPMDGGRMLRAILAMLLSYETATAMAATLGRCVAVVLGAWGFFFNPWLAVIGIFVYLGALGEERMVHLKHRFAGRTLRECVEQDPLMLSPEDPIRRCLDAAYDIGQEDFVVTAEGRVVGLLPRRRWIEGLRRASPDQAVSTVMQERFASVREDADLYEGCRMIAGLHQELIPVHRPGRAAGYVRLESLRELLESAGRVPDEPAPAGARSRAPVARGLDLG
jgi:Zn-dependent protease